MVFHSSRRAAHIQIYLEIFTRANPHFFQHFPTNRRQRNQQSDLSSLQTIILLNLLWCGQAGIYPAAALVWSAQSRDECASAPSECPCGFIPLQVLGISYFHWHSMALSFPSYPCMESRALSLDLQPRCRREGVFGPLTWTLPLALLGGWNYISHSHTWEIFHPSLVNLYIPSPHSQHPKDTCQKPAWDGGCCLPNATLPCSNTIWYPRATGQLIPSLWEPAALLACLLWWPESSWSHERTNVATPHGRWQGKQGKWEQEEQPGSSPKAQTSSLFPRLFV